ncbi:hypothetical protein C6Y14_06595 [Streptomyces dioscori]|uniref:Uncharacterized protein n=1 Tax=Streptomyces dioscori TaxID=2109333 RepID=A0A2P8QCS7_9ACTN|nr:hypothetical protein [Streptomyces dioscori]PSM44034.1 hypothetical protein C6Y14_06595 [Streptomyces dioscori]
MPQPNSVPTRPCPDCKGFSVATITTGDRSADGTRETVTVCCSACQGRGFAPAWVTAPISARAGK